MDASFFRDLLVNGTVLLVASILFTNVFGVFKAQKLQANILIGMIAGIAGILVLFTTVHYSPGIVFDTRSILVSTISMFFGWIPALIAVSFIAAARVIMGGGGTFTGILVTVATAAVGLIWRKLRIEGRQSNDLINKRFSALEFYLVGFATHLVMLACMLTLPADAKLTAIAKVSLPILFIYPSFSLLICLVLISRLRQIRAYKELTLSESRFRTLYEQAPIGVAFIDQHGRIHGNQMAVQILGSPMEELSQDK